MRSIFLCFSLLSLVAAPLYYSIAGGSSSKSDTFFISLVSRKQFVNCCLAKKPASCLVTANLLNCSILIHYVRPEVSLNCSRSILLPLFSFCLLPLSVHIICPAHLVLMFVVLACLLVNLILICRDIVSLQILSHLIHYHNCHDIHHHR